MTSARTKIGRIRLKSGGAEVRVIARPTSTKTIERIREWFTDTVADDEQPTAFLAVAFYPNPADPAATRTRARMQSSDAAFPIGMLPRMAAHACARMAVIKDTYDETLYRLGYVEDDDES